jgi:hypothetical protein
MTAPQLQHCCFFFFFFFFFFFSFSFSVFNLFTLQGEVCEQLIWLLRPLLLLLLPLTLLLLLLLCVYMFAHPAVPGV